MDLMKNEKVRAYMELVCGQIKFKDIHENIKEELLDHIDNIVEEDMEKNLTLEEAIDGAIKQMGDPYILGQELNKVHKPKPEWSILALTFIFTLIGIVALYVMSIQGLWTDWRIKGMIKNSAIMFVAGIAIIVGLYFFDYRKFKPFSKYLYIGTSLLSIFVEGHYRIFNIETTVFVYRVSRNLAYITPFLYAIALSGMFSEDRWQKGKRFSNLIILFLPMIISLRLATMTPIIMYFTMALVLIFVSKGSVKYIFGSIGVSAIAAFLSIINYPYKIDRLKAILNPFKNGYMDVQLRNLISSAGLLGDRTNIDKIEKPILDLPEMHTDYIFSYIIYAFGWLIGISIITLSIVFFIRLIKTAKSIEDSYGRLLVSTFSSLLIIQFVYNILMALGLAPVAGISMPFISYGTVLNMVNMIMIGIISSVYRRKNIVEKI